jgi:hypothetical protein
MSIQRLVHPMTGLVTYYCEGLYFSKFYFRYMGSCRCGMCTSRYLHYSQNPFKFKAIQHFIIADFLWCRIIGQSATVRNTAAY